MDGEKRYVHCPSYFITKNNLRMTEKVKIFKEKTKINVYFPVCPSFFVLENKLRLLRMTERSEKTSKNGLKMIVYFLDPMMLVVL
jgi:hypothetical protein